MTNPWQVLLSIWRDALLAFVRLPWLILGCFLLYTFLSAYWFHDFPLNVPRGLASAAGYELLHGVVFAPLVLGVMLMAIKAEIRSTDLWGFAAISIGAVILLRDLVGVSIGMWLPALARYQFFSNGQLGMNLGLARVIYALPVLLFSLAVLLLSVRFILLLPLLGVEQAGWKDALSNSWRLMKGHYGFALATTIAALLPLLVAEHFLIQLRRSLMGPVAFASPLSLQEWEVLMVRSGELTLEWLLNAALAARLYLAIRARGGALLSDASLAHHRATS